MSRHERALATFMSACPPDWAELNLFPVLLGALCRTDPEFERDFVMRTSRTADFLREAIRTRSIALLFDGTGALRAHATAGPSTESAAANAEPRMSVSTWSATGVRTPARTLYAKDRLGFDRKTLRGVLTMLQGSPCAYEIRQPGEPDSVRRVRSGRPRAGRAGVQVTNHVLLDLSNIASLFNDDTVCPNEFFSELEYDATLGNLLWLTSMSLRHYESLSSLEFKVRLQQYHIHRTGAGPGEACLTWAWVSDRTLRRLQRRPDRPLSIHEINDGEHLLLEAVAAGPFACSEMFRAVKDSAFAGVRDAYFRTAGRIVRVALDDAPTLDLVGRAINARPEADMTWDGVFDEFQ